ncbi:hypothetical protein S40293_10592 [Stachybotrys chartarum IBT 40293]|nr:hypothetical protein S40293_10592 [Stachybotrys chartarum IBT 40293]
MAEASSTQAYAPPQGAQLSGPSDYNKWFLALESWAVTWQVFDKLDPLTDDTPKDHIGSTIPVSDDEAKAKGLEEGFTESELTATLIKLLKKQIQLETKPQKEWVLAARGITNWIHSTVESTQLLMIIRQLTAELKIKEQSVYTPKQLIRAVQDHFQPSEAHHETSIREA